MRKAAVLVVDGYEESETVTIVDLLRRAGIECHTFGFAEQSGIPECTGALCKRSGL